VNGAHFRAWRFGHPDFAMATQGLSISTGGGIEMVEEPDSIRQAILILLTTLPGERVMRPAYGCELYRLIFSPNDTTTAGLAIHFVRRALERFERRVEIMRLDANRNRDDPDRLDITLEYRIRAVQRIDQIALSMNLAGERA
jgi:phage baseplate assembly protein W